jgi:murein DD-endopeptidase MepM/ murein hydrolase activator NlpD
MPDPPIGPKGVGYDPKDQPTTQDKIAAARANQKSEPPKAPGAPAATAPPPMFTGEATVVVEDTFQQLFPPDFVWFVNSEDNTLGVLQDPRIRVFVMGIEISPWVTQVQWAQDAKAEVLTSNASVTLKSMKDLFMLTEENLFEDLWRDQVVDWRTSEAPKRKLFQYKTINNVYDLRTKVNRWNLNPNTCIFHNSDTIRIFAKMPWTLEDCWQPVFTGYIEDPNVTRHQLTGEQTITFQAVTIADKLNKARVMTNPQAASLIAVSSSQTQQVRLPGAGDALYQSTNSFDSAELFNDVANPRQQHNFLYNTSIKSICEFIFYGDKIDDENETLSWDKANKENATPEGQRIAKMKKQGELQNQLAGLKSRLKMMELAYPPTKTYDDEGNVTSSTDSARVAKLKEKIKSVEAEIAAGEKSQDSINASNATADQALKTDAEKTKAAADKAQKEHDDYAKALAQKYPNGDIPDSEKEQLSKLQAEADAAKKAADISSSKYATITPEGVIRKHGFGFLHPDLFIIEDYPYTGQVLPVDTTQATNANGDAVKEKTISDQQQQQQANQPPPDTTRKEDTAAPPGTTPPLKKVWPVSTKQQSTSYGSFWYFRQQNGAGDAKRYHHTGIDVFAGQGSTLYAPIDGRIQRINLDWGNSREGGTYIEFLGDDGYLHRFMHLSYVETSLSVGQKITVQTVLGKTGGAKGASGSGSSTTGAHLHWDIQATKGGKLKTESDGHGNFVNPNAWFADTSIMSSDPAAVTNDQKRAAEKAAADARKARDANQEIDAEISLRDSYSSLDRTAEGQWMSIWHARCLFGFANGTPQINDRQTVTTISNRQNASYSDTIETVDPEIFTPKELKSMAEKRPNAWLSEDEVTYIGINSDWLGVYSPHGKSVAVAYKRPKAGFGISRGLEGNEVQSVSYDGTFQSRAQILSEFLQRIDYRWWITGNGDIVIDFPRYDLKPEDYGNWSNYLMVEGEISDDQYKEAFSSVPSAYMIKGGWGGGAPSGANNTAHEVLQVVYQLPNSLIRNGVNIKHISYPYVTNPVQLQMLGGVRINKDIANAIQIPMGNLPPILTITPNCPIYLFQQDAYAMVDQVRFQWSIGGDKIQYNMNLDTSAIRVRMTREQAYLEDLMDESDATYKDAIKKLRDEKLTNEEKIKRLDELKQNRGRVPEITPANYQKWLGDKNLSGVPRYRHIQGKSSLIMDYRKAFTQNLAELGRYQTGALQAGDIMSPILVGSPQVALANSDRSSEKTGCSNSITFTSTEIVLGDGRDIESLLNDTGMAEDSARAGDTTITNTTKPGFDKAKECPEDLAKGMSDISKTNGIDPATHQAIMAYGNTVSNFQPAYAEYGQDGEKISNNEGIFGLQSSQVPDNMPKGESLPEYTPPAADGPPASEPQQA